MPVSLAPLLGNFVALFVVALVAAFIASDRLAGLIPSRRLRLVVALYFALLPTTYMTLGSITFIQFYLAIFLLAAAVSDAPRTRVESAGTYAAVVLAAATGPFGLLFLPLFAGRLVLRRDTYSALMLASVALPAIAQAAALLTHGHPGAAPPTTDPLAIMQSEVA